MLLRPWRGDKLPVEQLQISHSLRRRELVDHLPARLAQRGLITLDEMVHVGDILLVRRLRLRMFLLSVPHQLHG